MIRRIALACIAATPLAASAAPSPADFAWRAPLEVPQGASLVRVEIPASALVRVKHGDVRDVRIFNSAGEAVPFAWIAPPEATQKPAEERTATFPALPLHAATGGRTAPRGSVQVRIEGDDRSMWVRMDGAPAAPSDRVNAVIFATRAEARTIQALDVQATLPANSPVRIAVSTSPDLAAWTPVAVRGRLYRFDGTDAPSNMRLEFDPPVALKDRYLRLDWDGQPNVSIDAVSGIVASAAPARRLRADLPAATATASDTIEIATGFAAPMAALAIQAPRDNTVIPVRVLGRSDVAQPWRVLGNTVVYRLGQGSDQVTNPPLEVGHASARWLRIVATDKSPLAPAQLRAAAEFRPVELLFVASGAGPFTLAAGSDEAAPAALPAATLTGTLGSRKVQDVPRATVGAAVEVPGVEGGPAWLAAVPRKDLALWSVLVIGVLVLGAVAWSLLRQMKAGA